MVGYEVFNVILNDLELLGSLFKIRVPRLTLLVILVTTLISILTRLYFLLMFEIREIGVNLTFKLNHRFKRCFGSRGLFHVQARDVNHLCFALIWRHLGNKLRCFAALSRL